MSQRTRDVRCLSCGYPHALIYKEIRYHGLRSRCPICGSDYPES